MPPEGQEQAVNIEADLARFLREQRFNIVDRWESLAKARIPALSQLPQESRRNHMPDVIDRLAWLTEHYPHGEAEGPTPGEAPETLALKRFEQGLQLMEHYDELSLLRLAIAQVWRQTNMPGSQAALDVLVGLVDYLARQAVAQYATARDRMLVTLDSVSQIAIESSNLDVLLRDLLEIVVREAEDVDGAAVLVCEDRKLVLRAAAGIEASRPRITVDLGTGFAGRVALESKPRLLHAKEIAEEITTPELRALGIRVLYGVPLKRDNEVIGVLQVGARHAAEFSPLTLQLTRAIADRAGLAIGRRLDEERFREATRAAHREETLFRLALEAMGEGFLGIDSQGRGTFANAAACRILGYDRPDELVGKVAHELIHHTRADGTPYPLSECPSFKTTLDGERVVLPEELMWRRDGKPVWVEYRAYPIYQEGALIGGVLAFNDITEKREAELERKRALEEAERERIRLRAVLDSLPIGVTIAGSKGQIEEFNPELLRVLRGPEPFQQAVADYTNMRGWWSDSGEPVKEAEWPLTRAVKKGEKTTSARIDLQRLDGSLGAAVVSAAPIRQPDGTLIGAVSAIQDVTQLRELELALRNRQAELDAMLGSIPDGLLVYEHDAQVKQYNAEAARLLHHLAPEYFARPDGGRLGALEILDLEGNPVALDEMPVTRALRGEVVHSAIFRLPPTDEGDITWVSASAAPIRGRRGEVSGAVVTLTDVTRLHRLQEQQQNLIRMVSHDLRTPLATITMQAKMLTKIAENSDVARRGQILATSAHRMQVMIADLVDTARHETGQLSVDKQPLDVAGFLRELRTRMQGVLDMERVEVDVVDGLPMLPADPDRFERIVVNLVSNALKYSPKGTPVRVVCREARNGVEIVVSDEGTGIDPEALPHIFDRYYRVERTRGTEGLGLGLAITRMLVEAHGGTISAESELGKGSTFHVWMPA